MVLVSQPQLCVLSPTVFVFCRLFFGCGSDVFVCVVLCRWAAETIIVPCGCVAARLCVGLVLSSIGIAPLDEEEACSFAACLLLCPQFVVSWFSFS